MAAVTAAALPVQAQTKTAPGLALVEYPSNKLANVADLKPNEPLDVSYPDKNAPGVLLKLGTRVEGGAGPDGAHPPFGNPLPHDVAAGRAILTAGWWADVPDG
jgi:arsenite oxidase small subunit